MGTFVWYTRDMLDDKDINKLTAVLASKQDVEEIKGELSSLKELVQGLIVATDSMAKSIDKLVAEYAAISVQLSRHDKWIKQLAEKAGIKLVIE